MNQSYIQFEDCGFDYKYFEISARTLAAPPQIQAKIYPPFADITFELADDFDKSTDHDGYSEYAKTIPSSHRAAVETLRTALENLGEEDWEWTPDDIEDVLTRPTWNKIRSRAQELLELFEIDLGEVPRCVETTSGTWSRGGR